MAKITFISVDIILVHVVNILDIVPGETPNLSAATSSIRPILSLIKTQIRRISSIRSNFLLLPLPIASDAVYFCLVAKPIPSKVTRKLIFVSLATSFVPCNSSQEATINYACMEILDNFLVMRNHPLLRLWLMPANSARRFCEHSFQPSLKGHVPWQARVLLCIVWRSPDPLTCLHFVNDVSVQVSQPVSSPSPFAVVGKQMESPLKNTVLKVGYAYTSSNSGLYALQERRDSWLSKGTQKG